MQVVKSSIQRGGGHAKKSSFTNDTHRTNYEISHEKCSGVFDSSPHTRFVRLKGAPGAFIGIYDLAIDTYVSKGAFEHGIVFESEQVDYLLRMFKDYCADDLVSIADRLRPFRILLRMEWPSRRLNQQS